ncbi:hypothetical protein PG996_014660 [Apiospora saccharicola]|uniref:Uncharacterized protein n=1 Tax=Apiospora saccharicola TaxID=335842 RepID=A0ABR1TL00_9PEZI
MRFLASLAVFLATAQASVTADALITTLNAFRDAATELQGEARKVDAKNCAKFQSGDGPLNVCVDTMHVAVEQASEFAGNLSGAPNYCGARGDDVLGAWKGFVDAHHRLFNILSHRADEVSAHRIQFPDAGEAMVSALTNVVAVGHDHEGSVSKGPAGTPAVSYSGRRRRTSATMQYLADKGPPAMDGTERAYI